MGGLGAGNCFTLAGKGEPPGGLGPDAWEEGVGQGEGRSSGVSQGHTLWRLCASARFQGGGARR